MIEMRWVTRLPKSSRLPPVKVLQYRQYSLDLKRGPVASWSDWIDVPTETEG